MNLFFESLLQTQDTLGIPMRAYPLKLEKSPLFLEGKRYEIPQAHLKQQSSLSTSSSTLHSGERPLGIAAPEPVHQP